MGILGKHYGLKLAVNNFLKYRLAINLIRVKFTSWAERMSYTIETAHGVLKKQTKTSRVEVVYVWKLTKYSAICRVDA